MTTMVVHVVAEWIIAGRTAPNGEGCEGTLNEWNEDKHQQKQQQKHKHTHSNEECASCEKKT